MLPIDVPQNVLQRAQSQACQALMQTLSPLLPPHYQDYPSLLQTNWSYLRTFLPDLRDSRVLDVGPGVGSFMVLARELNNEVYGIEQENPPTGVSAEVQAAHRSFLKAYQQITAFWKLDILRQGFHHFIQDPPMTFPFQEDSLDLIHFQRSLDIVLLRFENPLAALERLIAVCIKALRTGGHILVYHNTGPEQELAQNLFARCSGKHPVQVLNTDRITRIVKR